jgi:hypothetical protein
MASRIAVLKRMELRVMRFLAPDLCGVVAIRLDALTGYRHGSFDVITQLAAPRGLLQTMTTRQNCGR